ncbi:MAG: amidohydrolase family protein, partial [Burkholderiales bacterium]|nr:amidohydrolase family protein [Burkholderiales bacterium]
MAFEFDLIVAGGSVIDGTRAPRFAADVGVAGGRIAAIGDLAGQPARRRLDARGRIVAPGFVDAHTHDDIALLRRPGMDFKASQGVTTVVTGNCGISPAPLEP